VIYELDFSRFDGGFFRHHRFLGTCLGKIKGAIMSWVYLLSAALVAGIFVYLIAALFYPEKF
jgi:K+-transporting ATPase KdpF subunit